MQYARGNVITGAWGGVFLEEAGSVGLQKLGKERDSFSGMAAFFMIGKQTFFKNTGWPD